MLFHGRDVLTVRGLSSSFKGLQNLGSMQLNCAVERCEHRNLQENFSPESLAWLKGLGFRYQGLGFRRGLVLKWLFSCRGQLRATLKRASGLLSRR